MNGSCRDTPARFKEPVWDRLIVEHRELGDRWAEVSGYTPFAPHMEPLGRYAELLGNYGCSHQINKRAICVSMPHHTDIHAPLISRKQSSLMEKHSDRLLMERMKKEIAARIDQRIKELGTTQAAVAQACNMSTQRFGNYVQGTRLADAGMLIKIARALGTSTDWLLGVSEAGPPELAPIVAKLLELSGLPADRAQVIAETTQEALRILQSLPNEGGELLRSQMAAQAAWQARSGSKPGQ